MADFQISAHVNVTDPLIIKIIFIILSWLEKTHDNKKFSRKYSKPRRESLIKSNADISIMSKDLHELLGRTINSKLLKIIVTDFAKRQTKNLTLSLEFLIM